MCACFTSMSYVRLIFTGILKEKVHNNACGKLQELGTDTNLYALVFGESVLNDAVRRNFSLINTLLIFFILMLTKFLVPFYGLSIKVAISLYR